MMEGRKRVVIESVSPEIDCGRYPIKRVVGEKVVVEADVFSDGHDIVAARLLYSGPGDGNWREAPMNPTGNDRFTGEFYVEDAGTYRYTVEGRVDHFRTWQTDLRKKRYAGQDLRTDILVGVGLVEEAEARVSDERDRRELEELLTALRGGSLAAALGEELSGLMAKYPDEEFSTRYFKELHVTVDRRKALFSTWYERFPRSCGKAPGRHGTLADCAELVPELARMGFDVFYLPPIHPIGRTKRKGRNNVPLADHHDPGSPWAIGSEEGGHKDINPALGTIEDFRALVEAGRAHGVDIALDLAFQCSPDHPYVKKHPGWFRWRPDGTVQFAENPPKKYEDIIPINFESPDWKALWEELKSVVLFWIENGVRIFRVDNPHTKPFVFWEWLIREVKRDFPDVIFLSEAFTRPKVMMRLAKIGFSQSYTYFTWRNTKRELEEYLAELTRTEAREFFRPNFWPNTPDILPEPLQFGGRPAFMTRLILAATLSSNYGIYGPAFELLVSESFGEKEEYRDSEKYEVKYWDWERPGNIRDFIARINEVRRENPALQDTFNLDFYQTDNDFILFYGKATPDLANIFLVVVNLDNYHTQSGWVEVPLERLGIAPEEPYLVHDLISNEKYIWQGGRNFVSLNPHVVPAHLFRVRKRLRREMDFDYFM